MGYRSLRECVNDLEQHRHLIRVKSEVDPRLELSALQLRLYANQGPAVLFENVKGTRFPVLANLFGSIERSKFIFRDTLDDIKRLIDARKNPLNILRNPWGNRSLPLLAYSALPKRVKPQFQECKISDLPQIVHWADDGGPFVTLPAVYTEDMDQPGIMHSNLGMYRIQLGGNEYIPDQEIGLHYQIHRGIGIHQSKSEAAGKPLKVSIFVGGAPAHILSAVMPLPEGIPEVTFAGALNRRRFRFAYDSKGYCLSADADFVITGEIIPGLTKPEGPFGDHLGYYSLAHPFPVLKVNKVYHRNDAIWPFTVVGRPPQEDTSFGDLIHSITGNAIRDELPGVKEVHAVDAAGVHPLLLAIGSERYTPFLDENRPAEILTQANRILGTGQLSLAKWLFIAAGNKYPTLSTSDVGNFFRHVLERIDPMRDVHFQTNTSIDTLDYSGDGLNTGSKVVVAAGPLKIRELGSSTPELNLPDGFTGLRVVMAGVLALQGPKYGDNNSGITEINRLCDALPVGLVNTFPLIVVSDRPSFLAANLRNWLWETFTRSNPAVDVHGVKSAIVNKHWGCIGPLVIDARSKPHHAPELQKDAAVEEKINDAVRKGLLPNVFAEPA